MTFITVTVNAIKSWSNDSRGSVDSSQHHGMLIVVHHSDAELLEFRYTSFKMLYLLNEC